MNYEIGQIRTYNPVLITWAVFFLPSLKKKLCSLSYLSRIVLFSI
jgi:hypothetical protein